MCKTVLKTFLKKTSKYLFFFIKREKKKKEIKSRQIGTVLLLPFRQNFKRPRLRMSPMSHGKSKSSVLLDSRFISVYLVMDFSVSFQLDWTMHFIFPISVSKSTFIVLFSTYNTDECK